MKSRPKNLLFEPITKKSFSRFCTFLYERDLVTGVGGNVSARFGERFLITPSGLSLREIKPGFLLSVKPGGYGQRDLKPSKEFTMHLGIYRHRPDINVVCHIHDPYLISVSTLVRPGPNSIPSFVPGFVFFAYPLPMIPFFVPGTAELAEAVRQQFSNCKIRALLLQNHGLITVGRSLTEALDIAEETHENALVYLMTSGKGTPIPKDLIKKIF